MAAENKQGIRFNMSQDDSMIAHLSKGGFSEHNKQSQKQPDNFDNLHEGQKDERNQCCCNCYCNDDDYTVTEADTMPCSGRNCSGCAVKETRQSSRMMEDAAGDRRRSSKSQSEIMKHMKIRYPNFDAQEWLEKNKRLQKDGTLRFYNKSEVIIH